MTSRAVTSVLSKSRIPAADRNGIEIEAGGAGVRQSVIAKVRKYDGVGAVSRSALGSSEISRRPWRCTNAAASVDGYRLPMAPANMTATPSMSTALACSGSRSFQIAEL